MTRRILVVDDEKEFVGAGQILSMRLRGEDRRQCRGRHHRVRAVSSQLVFMDVKMAASTGSRRSSD